MSKLTIAAMLLGILGLGVGIYHLVETHPNEQAFFERVHESDMDRRLWQSYEDASDMQGLAMAILAGLGFVLGIIGWIQKRGVPGLLAIIMNLAVVLIPLATKTHMFS
ncbi:MAG: hypothetical protein RH862_14950 [Leptospiraceae bacterium]